MDHNMVKTPIYLIYNMQLYIDMSIKLYMLLSNIHIKYVL